MGSVVVPYAVFLDVATHHRRRSPSPVAHDRQLGCSGVGFGGEATRRSAALGQSPALTPAFWSVFQLCSYTTKPSSSSLTPTRLRAPHPFPFPVPTGVTKGSKARTTGISYEALTAVHQYVELDRAASAEGSAWRPPRRWGEPLIVSEPDARGGRINGIRRPWHALTSAERRRLVAPKGGSCLLTLKSDGGPFTAWPTVFERTANRIRARFEPRFPHVYAHRLRHTFSMRTQMSRVASGASFGKIRELILPATSPFGLDQSRLAEIAAHASDQAIDPAVALNATMLYPIRWHPVPDSGISCNCKIGLPRRFRSSAPWAPAVRVDLPLIHRGAFAGLEHCSLPVWSTWSAGTTGRPRSW